MNEQEQRPTQPTPPAPAQPTQPTQPTQPSSSIGRTAGQAFSSIQSDPDLQNAKAMLTELLVKNMIPVVLSAITFILFALFGMSYTGSFLLWVFYDFLFIRLQLIPKFGREHDVLLEKLRRHNQGSGAKLSLNESFYEHFTDKQVNILRTFMLAIMVAPFILSSLFFSIISINAKILRIIVYAAFFVGTVLTAAFYCNMNTELKHIDETYDSNKAKNRNLAGEFSEEEIPFIIQE